MKAKKAVLKIVDKKDKECPDWQKDFYANIKTERERLTLSEYELKAVLGDLIENIDQHFIESAFNFETSFDVEGFVDRLKPHARVVEKRIRRVLPDLYPDNPLSEPDAELTSMVMDLEKSAYVIGIFMGAKLAGASKDTLNLLRKHLML